MKMDIIKLGIKLANETIMFVTKFFKQWISISTVLFIFVVIVDSFTEFIKGDYFFSNLLPKSSDTTYNLVKIAAGCLMVGLGVVVVWYNLNLEINKVKK